MKKLVLLFVLVSVSFMLSGAALGAENDAAAPAAQKQAPVQRPMTMPLNRDIAFISGSITKIDTTVPKSIKIEIVNDADGKNHIVELGENTNILKVVDAAELKAGEKARIIAKKAIDKETAISVVTGKLKEAQMPPRPPAMQTPAPVAAEDQAKK